jgi:hypothetical protein
MRKPQLSALRPSGTAARLTLLLPGQGNLFGLEVYCAVTGAALFNPPAGVGATRRGAPTQGWESRAIKP